MSFIIIIAVIVLGVSLYDYFDAREWQHITAVDRINIVFGERNKKYGAYSIRRDYNDLIMIIVLSLFGLLGLFTIVSSGISAASGPVTMPVVEMDTTLLTLAAPPMDPIETIPTPYKVVGGGGSSGTPDNSRYDPTPDPMIKHQDTQAHSSTHVESGKGNSTTGKDPNAEASTTVKSPFSGSGGKNGGDGKGRFGDDPGAGSGPGTGPGSHGGKGGDAKRQLITSLPMSQIQSDEDCKVIVKVRVSPNGDVVATPIYVRAGSTTDNTTIINEVIRLVRTYAKFNKVGGTADQTFPITVKVNAN